MTFAEPNAKRKLVLPRRGNAQNQPSELLPFGMHQAVSEPQPEMYMLETNGRGERIRTSDPLVPNQVLYQAEPLPERCWKEAREQGSW